jgi:hypothetical protein
MSIFRSHRVAVRSHPVQEREIVCREDRRLLMGARSSRSTVLLLQETDQSGPLVLRTNRPWDRFLARLFASTLDRRLAQGHAPESTRLLAARAQRLVAPDTRQALADNWNALLIRARRPTPVYGPHVPLCRDRIVAAEHDVRDLVAALVAPSPTPAGGVAMVSRLLRDGAGPLFNRHWVGDLGATLRQAAERVDPSAALAMTEESPMS